jgi:hypothetical protein
MPVTLRRRHKRSDHGLPATLQVASKLLCPTSNSAGSKQKQSDRATIQFVAVDPKADSFHDSPRLNLPTKLNPALVVPSSGAVPSGGFKLCHHSAVVARDAVWPVLNRPVMWECNGRRCHTRADVVVCLTCGHVGCGREQVPQHALRHFKRHPGHCLAMHIPDGKVFCYNCNEWVLLDAAGADPRGDIYLLRQQLHLLTGSRVPGVTTRRGTNASNVPTTPLMVKNGGLPGLDASALEAEMRLDQEATATLWHERLLLAKVLMGWRGVTHSAGQSNEARSCHADAQGHADGGLPLMTPSTPPP